MDFTVEDLGKKVRVVKDDDLYNFTEGVICTLSHWSGDDIFGIDVGPEDGIHNCEGACDFGCGTWAYKEDFELF